MAQQVLQQFSEELDEIIDKRYQYEIEFHSHQATFDNFSGYLEAINFGITIRQHYGVIGIRKLLYQGSNVEKIIDAGLIPKLLEYVNQKQYLQLQFQAAWALTNIAAGTSSQCALLVSQGAIPLFVNLLASEHVQVNKQAMWGLANIASDRNQYRDDIIREGAMPRLIQVYEKLRHHELIECCCWAISTLCQAKYELICDGIPILCDAIVNKRMKNIKTISSCCEALSSDCKRTQKLKIIMESDLIPVLVIGLQDKQNGSKVILLNALVNISKQNEQVIDQLIALDVLTCLEGLINYCSRDIRRKANNLLQVISRGNENHVKYIILNHMEMINRVLSNFKASFSLIQQSLYKVIPNLVRFGCPQPLFFLFKSQDVIRSYLRFIKNLRNSQRLGKALQCLFVVLRTGEQFKENEENVLVASLKRLQGVQILQRLQNHKNDFVCLNANMILNDFIY